jgi:phage I-like protein
LKPSASILAYGVACECVTLAASADGEPIDWVKLLPMGRFGGRDGRGGYLVENLAHAQEIVAASKPAGSSLDPVVDYDHQTDLAAIKGVGGTAPAAGWIVEMQARADGIWGRIDWVAKAAASLKDREYRYLSPVFPHSKSTGRVLAILRAGLTNKPNLELGALASEADHPNGDDDLDKTLIAKALGLGEDATEEQIHAALATQTAALAVAGQGLALAAQAAGLSADAAAADVVTAINASRSAGDQGAVIVELQSQVNTLKANQGLKDGEAAVDVAIAAGKITPAARDTFIALHASDRAKFDAIVAAAPVLVRKGEVLTEKVELKDGELDDTAKAICASMGITPEAYLASQKDLA